MFGLWKNFQVLWAVVPLHTIRSSQGCGQRIHRLVWGDTNCQTQPLSNPTIPKILQ